MVLVSESSALQGGTIVTVRLKLQGRMEVPKHLTSWASLASWQLLSGVRTGCLCMCDEFMSLPQSLSRSNQSMAAHDTQDTVPW